MPQDLRTKLRMNTVHTILVLDAPQGFIESLGVLPDNLLVETVPTRMYDYIQAFFTTKAALQEQLPGILRMVKNDSLFWLCYPKPGHGIASDLNRDILAALVVEQTEWRCISQVALDDIWSALRARPKALVGS